MKKNSKRSKTMGIHDMLNKHKSPAPLPPLHGGPLPFLVRAVSLLLSSCCFDGIRCSLVCSCCSCWNGTRKCEKQCTQPLGRFVPAQRDTAKYTSFSLAAHHSYCGSSNQSSSRSNALQHCIIHTLPPSMVSLFPRSLAFCFPPNSFSVA